MGYPQFLSLLLEEGRTRVPARTPPTAEELIAGDAVLVEFERRYRVALPGAPPPFNVAAGRWAAMRFLRACQFYLDRAADASALAEELDAPLDVPVGPAEHYSVDIVFRFLPDLLKLVRAAASEDPLAARLLTWCRRWPLSSVGVAQVGEVSINGFADDACLLQLYCDRILAVGDHSRLADARVRAAARGALGSHLDLAGRLRAALKEHQTTGETECRKA
jgi:hypothetical protein